ncbi:MAG: ABC transporter permease [Thermoproteota archaeon]
MYEIKEPLRQLLHYKAAFVGLLIILFLVALSIYTIVALPYDRAVELWRAGEKHWLDNPRNALPSWINIFLRKKLPETIILDTRKPKAGVSKAIIPVTGKLKVVKIEFSFKYEYDDFPSELNMFLESKFDVSAPYVTVHWVKPTGEDIVLRSIIISKGEDRYYISVDYELTNNLKRRVSQKINKTINYDISAIELLFAVEDESILSPETIIVMRGSYKVWVEGTVLGEDSDLDAKLNVYGKVYGLAGTDHLRRDIGIAILWGTPIALSFGVLASLSITFINIILGAISAWFRGSIDTIIQRITEIFMIIPFLPIMIMLSAFYRLTLWNILLVVIFLSSFSASVKNYRVAFLQIKEFPYVEAARAYCASNFRIVTRYLIPKILPTIIPSIVLSVPDFVFLEAVLALLGIGDPLVPTWGKIVEDAFRYGALYKGLYYWILIPSFMLAITSLSFAMVGFTLDRIFNPKLKEM